MKNVDGVDIKVGDKVCLKSGGPEMVVEEMWARGAVECRWFMGVREEFVSDGFIIDALRKL